MASWLTAATLLGAVSAGSTNVLKVQQKEEFLPKFELPKLELPKFELPVLEVPLIKEITKALDEAPRALCSGIEFLDVFDITKVDCNPNQEPQNLKIGDTTFEIPPPPPVSPDTPKDTDAAEEEVAMKLADEGADEASPAGDAGSADGANAGDATSVGKFELACKGPNNKKMSAVELATCKTYMTIKCNKAFNDVTYVEFARERNEIIAAGGALSSVPCPKE